MFVCAVFELPSSLRMNVPRNAIGTEPSTIHLTRLRLTVRLRRCTAAPKGRIITAATRSLEIAAEGLTPNSRISIGVIRAPPPAPVMPTRKPMIALPRTMKGSMCIVLAGSVEGREAVERRRGPLPEGGHHSARFLTLSTAFGASVRRKAGCRPRSMRSGRAFAVGGRDSNGPRALRLGATGPDRPDHLARRTPACRAGRDGCKKTAGPPIPGRAGRSTTPAVHGRRVGTR